MGLPGPDFFQYKGFFKVHHDWTLEQVKKYGKLYGSYVLTKKLIVINEPDLLRDIMVKDFHIFPDRREFHMGSSKIAKSLFFMPGNDDWKRVRSILSPVFTSGKLRAMMAHISGVSDRFVNNLDEFEKNGKFMNHFIDLLVNSLKLACAHF